MPQIKFLKPNPDKKDIKVYDPVRRAFMPADGANVPLTAYWLERIRNKDVVDGNSEPDEDLSQMTVKQLQAKADELGLALKPTMKKADIIAAIQEMLEKSEDTGNDNGNDDSGDETDLSKLSHEELLAKVKELGLELPDDTADEDLISNIQDALESDAEETK